jgi:hypothetical protein
MNNPQLKINLSEELQALLQAKAGRFGIPLTQYVKHILIKDVEDQGYPVFRASKSTEKEAELALGDLDKAVDSKDFFEKLRNEN